MTAPPKAACHPNPCLNGGICKETGVNQDFDCICPNPRFKGRFCDGKTCVIYANLCLNVILGYNLCQVILVQGLFSAGHSVLSWISIDQAKLHFSFGQSEVNFTKGISGKATKTKICNISATSLFLFCKIAKSPNLFLFVCLFLLLLLLLLLWTCFFKISRPWYLYSYPWDFAISLPKIAKSQDFFSFVCFFTIGQVFFLKNRCHFLFLL